MKNILFALFFLSATCALGQSTKKKLLTDTANQKITITYDTTVLRVLGKSLPIGITDVLKNGKTYKTKGFLKGSYGWRKFVVEADTGSFFNGKIKLKGGNNYKKNDSITVNVYTRKWFLGRKDKWLGSKKIPYDYETGIKILTKGNFSKAPGNHVQFGIRTFYDNKMSIDKWAPANSNLQDFVLTPNGSHISKSKGDLKIENDPVKITNDKAGLVAALRKNETLKDTLQIVMDYVDNYKCSLKSDRQGHTLKVTANVYNDSIIKATLMSIKVSDSNTKKTYNYLINTMGGSLAITSQGANGSSGASGSDGMSGSMGSSGSYTTDVETTTDINGNPTTTTTTTQGPGGDGGRGSDGSNGGDGGNGYNGGNVTITYTASAKPFLTLIKVLSVPGKGGYGGAGGRGGSGGSGGSGSPSGSTGPSGSDGFPGSNGAAGQPGKIIFVQH